MKIDFFYQHLPSFPGACAARAEAFIKGISNSEYFEIDKVYTTSGDLDFLVNGSRKNITIEKLQFLKTDNKQSLSIRFIIEILVGFMFALKIVTSRKPDVFVVSIPSYFMSVFICIALWIRRIPYVVEFRDLYPQILFDKNLVKQEKLLGSLLLNITKKIINRADGVVVTNVGIREGLKRIVPKLSAEVIYNGYKNSLVDDALLSSLGGNFRVCCHGILGHFQNIELLAEIIKGLEPHDIPVHVVGYGPQERVLDELDCKNFTFYGKLPMNETLKIVSNCSIGLSLRDGSMISKLSFPVKNWEYLGLEIPSINHPLTEAATFCEENGIGITIHDNDPRSFVKAITYFRDNPNQLQKLKANCHTVKCKYTREASSDNFLTYIHSIYSSNPQ